MGVGADNRQQWRQQPDPDASEHQSASAAEHGEQAAFGQQLAHEATARRAKRGPERQLPLARAGADEQQVRDVGAGDQQHAPDRAQEQEQGSFDGAAVARRIDRYYRGAPALVGVGIGGLQPPGDGVELGLRGFEGHAGGEASPDRDRVFVAAAEILVHRERHPQVEVRLQEVEVARQHPDNGERPPVHQERLSDDGRVATVASPPQPVAQDDDPVPAGYLLLRKKGAAMRRLHTEHREERRRDPDAPDLLGNRVAALGTGDRIEPVAPGHQVVERPALLPPVEEVAGGCRDIVLHHPALGRVHVPDAHEALDMLEGRRAEEEVVDDGEDGGVRPDTEGESQHRDEREAVMATRAP